MEIVSRPDMRSAAEAAAYVKKLRSILRYLGTCDGNMEEGSMRADVNVSVRRPGEPFGTRTETKNLNSMRFIQQAIDCEVARQIEIIEDGGEIAGGGIRGGLTYGSTDELGYAAEGNPVHVRDLHATMLKCLGINHTKLTFKFQGRHYRLTDVHGKLMDPILA